MGDAIAQDCLATTICCDLHRRMFGDVWRWAGDYRTFDVNIGNTPFVQVPMMSGRRLAVHGTDGAQDVLSGRTGSAPAPSPCVDPSLRERKRPFARLLADVIMKAPQSRAAVLGLCVAVETGEARAAYVAALARSGRPQHRPASGLAQS
jgi:hypothetical protein